MRAYLQWGDIKEEVTNTILNMLQWRNNRSAHYKLFFNSTNLIMLGFRIQCLRISFFIVSSLNG
jgi:hypothetical protein